MSSAKLTNHSESHNIGFNNHTTLAFYAAKLICKWVISIPTYFKILDLCDGVWLFIRLGSGGGLRQC